MSSLLSPSRELCDQPFELVVDQYAFVGHPVWLGDEESPREKPPPSPKADGSQSEDDGEDEDDESESDGRRGRSRRPRYNVDLNNLVLEDELPIPESSSRDQTIGPPQTRNASAPPRPLLVEQLSPSPPSSPMPLFARSHSSASTLLPLSSIASSQHSHNSLHGSGRLISFNFLCVIDTPPDSHLSSHLEGFYKDVIVPVTANIKAVEKKDIWLGKEVAKLRRAREASIEKGTHFPSSHFPIDIDCPRPRSPLEMPHDEFLNTLPARSPLAAAISQLYTSLKRNELAEFNIGGLPVQVLLRGELPIEDDADIQERERDDFLLHGPDGHESRSRSPSPGGGGGGAGYVVGKQMPAPLFSRMRKRPRAKFYPWQSLLLLEDAKHLQKDLMEGSVLERFLDICRPTLSYVLG